MSTALTGSYRSKTPCGPAGLENGRSVMHLGALALVLALLAPAIAAQAQQAVKVWRIGYLGMASAEIHRTPLAAFEQGLRDLGYVEGKNTVIERRFAAGRYERLPELAADLVRLKVDVLLAHGPAARDAQKATSTIPIVVVADPDPVGGGRVASLARPGGNITGFSDSHGDLVPKRLELLKEVVPSASRVAVLFNPTGAIGPPQLKTAQAAAPALGMTVLPVEVKGPEARDFDAASAAIRTGRSEALLAIGEPTVRAHQSRIVELAVKNRLPTIATHPEWAHGGFLMSYGANFEDLYRRAATYIDKILRGAKPAELPVQQPTKFDLVINMKTAKALGLAISPSLLLRADHVIH